MHYPQYNIITEQLLICLLRNAQGYIKTQTKKKISPMQDKNLTLKLNHNHNNITTKNSLKNILQHTEFLKLSLSSYSKNSRLSSNWQDITIVGKKICNSSLNPRNYSSVSRFLSSLLYVRRIPLLNVAVLLLLPSREKVIFFHIDFNMAKVSSRILLQIIFQLV